MTVIHTLADAADQLMAERDENVCRKDFTPTEAGSYTAGRCRSAHSGSGAGTPGSHQRKNNGRSARGRVSAATHTDDELCQDEGSKLEPSTPCNRNDDGGNLPPSSRPKTRDVAAKGTGYSGRTLDKVDEVIEIAESPETRTSWSRMFGLGRTRSQSGLGQTTGCTSSESVARGWTLAR